MDTYRAFLAIIISFVILLGYQYFFVGFDQPVAVEQQAPVTSPPVAAPETPAPVAVAAAPPAPLTPAPVYDRQPRQVRVETDLFSAIFSEDGGTIQSFVLKGHNETQASDSPGMELVRVDPAQGLPLQFSWGSAVDGRILYQSEAEKLTLSANQAKGELRLVGDAGHGLIVEKIFTIANDSYLIDLEVKVRNTSSTLLQGMPQVHLINTRFEGVASPVDRFLFAGPAAFINGARQEISSDDYLAGPKSIQGTIDWAGYEGNYFLCAIVPLNGIGNTFTMQGT